MQTYPIAGKLLEQKFLFGIAIRDLADVFSMPFVLVGLTSFTGIAETHQLWIAGLGFLVSIFILYKTPPAQHPRHWVIAYLTYHLGTTTYLNRPVERDRDPGMIQDIVISDTIDTPSYRP